jgi:hypothetical protein
MFAIPFLAVIVFKRPVDHRASAERLSGVWGLGYNIAHEGGRTGLVVKIFLSAFYRGAPRLFPARFSGTGGEEGE